MSCGEVCGGKDGSLCDINLCDCEDRFPIFFFVIDLNQLNAHSQRKQRQGPKGNLTARRGPIAQLLPRAREAVRRGLPKQDR